MSADPGERVDLVINVFERTYRHGLAAETIGAVRDANRFPFAGCVALINNVDDRLDAERRARALLERHLIDSYHFVADRIQPALEQVKLSVEDLEPLLHYSDAPIVAATLPGSPWMLYWDPEAQLAEPFDWITPALELLRADPRVMVANPSWEAPDGAGRRPGVERETAQMSGEFALGPGFSDQVFLAARAELAAPIYGQRCIGSLAYPTAHRAQIFEARVGAHMRHHGRVRATSTAASYLTSSPAGGSSYRPAGPLEAVRYVRNALVVRALRASPWRPRCLRNTWL